MNGFALLFWMVLSGIVGAVIGSSRKSTGAGFVFGALLGPLGWIIALFNDNRSKCPECKGRVPDGARKCLHCGSKIELVEVQTEVLPPPPENPIENYKKWKAEHPNEELPPPSMSHPVEEYKKWKTEKGIQ
jgi:hypothetical protein